jgi:tetraacyldisaccharide 4'-kinase
MPAPLTLPLSWLYGTAVGFRNRLYDARSERAALGRLPVPVVSVGNVTVGGSGKTPTVEALARRLIESGKSVGVLSRGYGRRSRRPFVLASDGNDVFATPEDAGDEPIELARKIPGLVVAVGPNRHNVGERLLERFPLDVLLLDDGFQHRSLHRDLDLVCVDVSEREETLRLLPRGRLREPLSSLRRANALIWTGWPGGTTRSREKVERALTPGTPVLRARAETLGLYRVGGKGGESLPPDALRGRPVAAVAGLAKPERMLESVDADIVLFEPKRDHFEWSQSEIEAFTDRALNAGAEAVLTSGKDAVKLASFVRWASLPMYEVRVVLSFLDPGKVDLLLQSIGSA